MSYDAVNQPWLAVQALNPFDNQVTHLNGSGATRREIADDGILGLVSLATSGLGASSKGLQSLKSSPALYNQFSKNSKGLFKGANHSLLRSNAYRTMLNKHNGFVKNVKHIKKTSSRLGNTIDITQNILED